MAYGTPTTGTIVYSATTPISPAQPTHNWGDLQVLIVGVKPDTASISTPTGWNTITNAEQSGGGGTTGIDTGPTRIKMFWRIAPNNSTGTVAVTLSGQNVAYAVILNATTAATAATAAGSNGVDTTGNTSLTATMNVDPGIAVNDLLIWAAVIPTDVTTPAQFSAPTITGTGITTSCTELGEPDTSTGHDLGGVYGYATVSAGPSSAAPTFTTTAGGTTTNVVGPILVVRFREDTSFALAPDVVRAPKLAPPGPMDWGG